MAHHLKDRVRLAVFFNDMEFPFSAINGLNFCHIVAATSQALPSFVLSIKDGEGWLKRNNLLADGTRVRIEASEGSTSRNQSPSYDFRLLSHRSPETDTTPNYVLEGLLDTPRYLGTSIRTPYNSTSSDVLKKLAELCGLGYEGVGTSDPQVWLPGNKRVAHFAQFVALRGYANDNSCMCMAVDLDKKLRYRDVTGMDAPRFTLGYRDFSSGSLPFISHDPQSSSGARNFLQGYAATHVEQRLDNVDTPYAKHLGIGTQLNEGGTPNMSAEMKSSVREGHVRHGPVSNGNAHINSERALYQNIRGLSLYNVGISVVCLVNTDVKVMDTVDLSFATALAQAPLLRMHEGMYRVTKRIIYITESQYSEKLVLMRRTNKMAGADVSIPASTTAVAPRTVALAAPASSTISLPSIDLDPIKSALPSLDTLVKAGVAVLTTTLASRNTENQASLADAPSIDTPLNALLVNITAIKNAGIAAIDQVRATDPTDQDMQIPGIIQAKTLEVDTAVTAQTPAIQQAAERTRGIATASQGLASGSAALANVGSAFSAATAKLGSALSAVTRDTALASTGSAMTTANSGLASDSTAATTAAANQISSNATAQIVRADAWPGEVAAARAAAIAEMNAR